MHENDKLAIFEYTTSILSLIINSKNIKQFLYLELSSDPIEEALKNSSIIEEYP